MNTERYAKQSIVVRADLKMPVGKVAAQVAHASMAVILNKMGGSGSTRFEHEGTTYTEFDTVLSLHSTVPHEMAMIEWIEGSFTKVVLAIDNEEELLALYDKAVVAGVPCSKIVDNGLTVFNGVKTLTCCAFGPIYSDELQQLTGHLKLYR